MVQPAPPREAGEQGRIIVMSAPLGRRLLNRVRATLVYSGTSLGTGFACMLTFVALMFSAVLCLVGIGLWLLPRELRLLGRFTDFERRRASRRLDVSVRGPGVRARRLLDLLAEPATRRDLRWVPVRMVLGSVLGVVGFAFSVIPAGALFSIFFWWLFPAGQPIRVLADLPIQSWGSALYVGLPTLATTAVFSLLLAPKIADVDARLSARLLAPSAHDELVERVETLQVTRAGALDSHGAELRRIERDLHDGTQARLVSIAMRLGLAERELERDPQAVAALLAEAREGAEDAMTELRDVLRSMYPPILADRGLAGALAAVVARCSVPAELTVGDLGTIAAPIEAAVYYVVAESLTNVVKHSGASKVEVTLTRDVDLLLAQIVDDGRGGVDESLGTGVAGMRRRVAALDGTLRVTSPAGGPTRVLVECACES
jgi:signal transduction histidine kinase